MNDYMQALHQRFCREPTHPELERALDDTYHALRGNIAWQDQELLLRAQDLEIELREETSLASFIAGFRLGMGIAREIEPYSFEDEEERRATEKAESVASPVQKLIRYTKKKGCRRQLFLNFLITVTAAPGYFFFLWYVVSLQVCK